MSIHTVTLLLIIVQGRTINEKEKEQKNITFLRRIPIATRKEVIFYIERELIKDVPPTF